MSREISWDATVPRTLGMWWAPVANAVHQRVGVFGRKCISPADQSCSVRAGQPGRSNADSWWPRTPMLDRGPAVDGRDAPRGRQAVQAGMSNSTARRGSIISECRAYMPQPAGGAEV